MFYSTVDLFNLLLQPLLFQCWTFIIYSVSTCTLSHFRYIRTFPSASFLRGYLSRLCSSGTHWPLAPNFCSKLTRKSYFFHKNHMLGTMDFTGSEPCVHICTRQKKSRKGDLRGPWFFPQAKHFLWWECSISAQLVWHNFRIKDNFHNKWLVCGWDYHSCSSAVHLSDKLHVLSHCYTNMQGWSFRLIHAYYTAPLQACSSSYK